MKNPGAQDLALSYLQRRLLGSFLGADVCWSKGVDGIPNFKHQISGFQVSGVRCQGRKTTRLKPEH
jgi:hypothetical protein